MNLPPSVGGLLSGAFVPPSSEGIENLVADIEGKAALVENRIAGNLDRRVSAMESLVESLIGQGIIPEIPTSAQSRLSLSLPATVVVTEPTIQDGILYTPEITINNPLPESFIIPAGIIATPQVGPTVIPPMTLAASEPIAMNITDQIPNELAIISQILNLFVSFGPTFIGVSGNNLIVESFITVRMTIRHNVGLEPIPNSSTHTVSNEPVRVVVPLGYTIPGMPIPSSPMTFANPSPQQMVIPPQAIPLPEPPTMPDQQPPTVPGQKEKEKEELLEPWKSERNRACPPVSEIKKMLADNPRMFFVCPPI